MLSELLSPLRVIQIMDQADSFISEYEGVLGKDPIILPEDLYRTLGCYLQMLTGLSAFRYILSQAQEDSSPLRDIYRVTLANNFAIQMSRILKKECDQRLFSFREIGSLKVRDMTLALDRQRYGGVILGTNALLGKQSPEVALDFARYGMSPDF